MDISGYTYSGAAASHTVGYLLGPVMKVLDQRTRSGAEKRIFEVGCGNGAVACMLAKSGYKVVGVDPSVQGIEHAKANYPGLDLRLGSTDEELAKQYGTFPFVLSLEVIEHVFLPKVFARRVYELLTPGGLAIISTPYHGYVKNLALALSGKMDAHFTALWDYGHIKFFSRKTLGCLLAEAGFRNIRFLRVGRIPMLAKSMIALAEK